MSTHQICSSNPNLVTDRPVGNNPAVSVGLQAFVHEVVKGPSRSLSVTRIVYAVDQHAKTTATDCSTVHVCLLRQFAVDERGCVRSDFDLLPGVSAE